MGIIFDLDQTLVDSKIALNLRKIGLWKSVYELIPKFQIFDGITDAWAYINDHGIKIAIVTTSPSTYCNKVLNHFEIKCDLIVAYHDTTRRKPYPDPFNRAAELLNLNKQNMLTFGDDPKDIIASKAAGIKSVGCTWGCNDINDLQFRSADFIIHKPTEIKKVVQRFYDLKG